MTSMHSGQRKSGPWLLQHVADVSVQPNVKPPGQGVPVQPQAPAPVQHTPVQPGDWVNQDWRNGNGGAFNSSVRPPMSSDIPHPDKVLDPANKRHQALINHTSASTDPEHDPWNVLHGSGHSFEDLVSNHQGHLANMTPDQDYQGRVWYRAAHEGTKDLADKTTGDHGRAVSTMSAFSPKTAWDENVEKGHHFLTHYDGSPDFTMPGMGDHVEKAKQIYHAPGDSYKDVIKGPKTSAFANNILDPTPMREPRPGEHDDAGYYQHPHNEATGEHDWRLSPDQDSTIDTHHVRMTNTPHGADLNSLKYETPKYFGKKVTVDGKSYDPSYDLHSRAAWEATRRHNAAQPDSQRHLLPKQTQAGPWTKFKNDVDSAGKGAGFNEPGVAPKSWTPDKKNWDQSKWEKTHPLTKAIPRYQQDHGDWEDPRRPKQDLRQAPNWHRHRKSSTNSPWWDAVLADYIARHPQHPAQPEAARFATLYFAADGAVMEESVEIKKRPVRTKPYSKTHNKLPKTIHQPKEPKKMVGAQEFAAEYFGTLKKAAPPAAPGAQPPGGNWGAMPDVKLGPSAPAGYQPGATPAAAWTKTPAPSSSYSTPSGGGSSSVSGAQTNKGTTGPDTHGSILPDTAEFKTNLQKQFPQLNNIGGYRDPDGFNEHSSGHALDVMIPDAATQNQVRDWTLKQPNVNYVLNQQKQWNPDGSISNMDNRGSPTANHFDHLHVNVADAIKPLPGLTGLDSGGSSAGDQNPGGGTSTSPSLPPMTIARRFAMDYFARDRDDQDQEPGVSTGPSSTPNFTPTNSAGYGGASGVSPANMVDIAPPSPGSFTPSFGGGSYSGGGSAGSAPYTGGGGGNTGVTPGPGGIPVSIGPDGHAHSTDPAWEHLLERESGGVNQRQHGYTDVNTGGNEAEGFFQITPKTWAGAGGTKYAPSPMSATVQQQADIAAGIFRKNPSGSDWGAGLPGREDPGALAKGLSAPASTGPSLPSVGAPAGTRTSSMHSGTPKSGAWLLEASRNILTADTVTPAMPSQPKWEIAPTYWGTASDDHPGHATADVKMNVDGPEHAAEILSQYPKGHRLKVDSHGGTIRTRFDFGSNDVTGDLNEAAMKRYQSWRNRASKNGHDVEFMSNHASKPPMVEETFHDHAGFNGPEARQRAHVENAAAFRAQIERWNNRDYS